MSDPTLPRSDINKTTQDLQVARWQLGHRDLPKRQTFRQFLMCLAMVITVIYLAYRVTMTLNLETWYATTVSVGLLVGEIWGAILLFLYFIQVWRLIEPPIKPPLSNKTVDVLIPTYNEDPHLLRGTIKACIEMDYPHKTYVLDDGEREEVRLLAEELGAHYIGRTEHQHAKAGNLNNALSQITGEFVVILDADHVPLRHFITRMLGYFEDEKMSFIQAPHTSYNLDNVVGQWNAKSRTYWEDVHLFYSAVQLGRNNWNAATFCGSAAMFRRSALDDIGGVATETITEDLHTGLRLHAKGWKSLAISEQLISGQAPEDIKAYNSQRQRWGEGNMSVVAYDNPLTMKGLKFSQRINYLGCILNWTAGIPRLLLYFTPILLLFSGVGPVNVLSVDGAVAAARVEYFTLLGLYLASIWTAFKVASNGVGNLLGVELMLMGAFWVQVKSVFRAVFMRRFQRFVVTKKTAALPESDEEERVKQKGILKYIVPQLTIGLLGIVAIFWGGMDIALGLKNNYVGYGIAVALVLINGYLALLVVLSATRQQNRRRDWRHPAKLLVKYAHGPAGTAEQTQINACSVAINENGISLITYEEPVVGETLSLHIISPTKDVVRDGISCDGEVTHVEPIRTTKGDDLLGYCVEVQFLNITDKLSDDIWTLALQYIVPQIVLTHQATSQHLIGEQPAAKRGRKFRKYMGHHAIEMPITFELLPEGKKDTKEEGVVRWLTDQEARISTQSMLLPDSWVNVRFNTPDEIISDRVQVRRSNASRIGTSVVQFCSLDLTTMRSEARSKLQHFVKRSHEHKWADTITKVQPHMASGYHKPTVNKVLLFTCCFILASTAIFYKMYDKDLFLINLANSNYVTVDDRSTFDKYADDFLAKKALAPARAARIYNAAEKVGDDRRAALAAMHVVKGVKQDADWLRVAGTHYMNAGMYKEASEVFQEIYKDNYDLDLESNQQKNYYLTAARNAVDLKDAKSAISYFQRAAAQGQLDAEELTEFANALVDMGAVQGALIVLEMSDELPDDAKQIKANLLMQTGGPENLQEAFTLYSELLAKKPNDPVLLTSIANAAVTLRAFTTGANYFERLAFLYPDDQPLAAKLRQTYLDAARECVADENYARAVEYFKKLNPVGDTKFGTEAILREYANAFQKNGQVPEAITLLRDQTSKESRIALAGMYEMTHQFTLALGIYTELLKQDPKNPNLLASSVLALEITGGNSALALQQMETLKKAVTAMGGKLTLDDEYRYVRLLAKQDKGYEAFVQIAALQAKYGNSNDLIKLYLDVVAANVADSPQIRQQTLQIYEQLLHNGFDSTQEADFLTLARAMRQLGLLRETAHLLQIALQQNPDSKQLLLLKAQTLADLGHADEAELVYAQLLKAENL